MPNGIVEVEVGLDELERAFDMLAENVQHWKQSVLVLGNAGVSTITIRGGVSGLMRIISPPPPPPQVGAQCWEFFPLNYDYLLNLGAMLNAIFGELMQLNDGPDHNEGKIPAEPPGG